MFSQLNDYICFMQNRIEWVDQVKGFAILLVVYGHNFPITEQFIYTFHMPLFFMVSGFFFPKELDFSVLRKRFKTLLVPYFFWAFLLFLFWLIIGRQMGRSGSEDLSITQNFLGIFYSQGGKEFMDWGIPMWFLPCLFVTYLFYFFLNKYLPKKMMILSVLLMTALGFLYTRLFSINLPWSFNIACVAVFFLMVGNLSFPYLSKWKNKWSWFAIPILMSLQWFLYDLNSKVDMYRSEFGHSEIVFLVNGLVGSFIVILIFKLIPYFKPLSIVGKYTLLILALQLVAMSFIKLCLWKGLGITDFSFSEWEKLLYSIVQIILIYPVFLVVNYYYPLLNGTTKRI